MDKDIKRYLQRKAEEIRSKYDINSCEDLENIAINEFGIEGCVQTNYHFGIPMIKKLVGTERFVIFYNGLTEESRKTTLAFEMGHKVAMHLHERKGVSYLKKEREANYFTEQLLGIKRRENFFYQTLDNLYHLTHGIKLITFGGRDKEKQKILDAGLGDFVKCLH